MEQQKLSPSRFKAGREGIEKAVVTELSEGIAFEALVIKMQKGGVLISVPSPAKPPSASSGSLAVSF